MTLQVYDNPSNDIEDDVETSTTTTEVNVNTGTRHAFFRDMDADPIVRGSGSRRVFGGSAMDLKNFNVVCALLDRYLVVRCTATIITPHWVLTAAHCVTSRLAYVKYNTRRPASTDGNITAIHFLYQHPRYRVVQKDEGRGLDVTELHHDVGLVRTRVQMKLANTNSILQSLRSNDAFDLYNKVVQVLGFGRTERAVLGEELFGVELRLVGCEREDWVYCVCGVAKEGIPRGVCSGDSGGPVLYQGVPIGVTSMGPVECKQNTVTPPVGATSVFTTLYQYSDVINATIQETEAELRMRRINHASTISSLCQLLSLTLLIILPSR
ncbi:unnamed protein product [Euphydryas editha]|uniref:Peptidase S1 domain-containing protein n=1 Tax=Euphydryas editha TaxID=104508 RepID=A0AAU9ULE3_EUPED|nr:unnamed protein product [Euphydryas editha]